MRDSPLRLNDKTIVLYGPGHSITQAIGSFLADQGADVAFVGPEASSMKRFSEGLMENRQVRPASGRSAVFPAPLNSEKDDRDVFSKVAETFGGVDVYVDAHLEPFPQCQYTETRRRLARTALEFLCKRRRGRLLFLGSKFTLKKQPWELSREPQEYLKELILQIREGLQDKSVTVNALSIGLTEEFFLFYAKEKTIKESWELTKKAREGAELVEPVEIASLIAFLLSPLSSALTGQIFQVDRGFDI